MNTKTKTYRPVAGTSDDANETQKATDAALDADVAATIAEAHASIPSDNKVAPKSKFAARRVKSVAVPLFKLKESEARFFLIEGPMHLGKQIDDKKEAATLVNVTDLESGELGQIIVGKVLHDLLNEAYEGDSYVGKRFEIELKPRGDKKYNTYSLFEITEDV